MHEVRLVAQLESLHPLHAFLKLAVKQVRKSDLIPIKRCHHCDQDSIVAEADELEEDNDAVLL